MDVPTDEDDNVVLEDLLLPIDPPTALPPLDPAPEPEVCVKLVSSVVGSGVAPVEEAGWSRPSDREMQIRSWHP